MQNETSSPIHTINKLRDIHQALLDTLTKYTPAGSVKSGSSAYEVAFKQAAIFYKAELDHTQFVYENLTRFLEACTNDSFPVLNEEMVKSLEIIANSLRPKSDTMSVERAKARYRLLNTISENLGIDTQSLEKEIRAMLPAKTETPAVTASPQVIKTSHHFNAKEMAILTRIYDAFNKALDEGQKQAGLQRSPGELPPIAVNHVASTYSSSNEHVRQVYKRLKKIMEACKDGETFELSEPMRVSFDVAANALRPLGKAPHIGFCTDLPVNKMH